MCSIKRTYHGSTLNELVGNSAIDHNARISSYVNFSSDRILQFAKKCFTVYFFLSLDKLILKNKKFADLLEEIYDNQKRKEKQISTLISELRPLIEDTGDATLIVPLIKEYLEIGVKNDDQLVKVATIIQRIFQNQD